MNENELYVVKEHKFDNPLITKTDSVLDSCYKDCHKKFFINFYCNVYMILNLQISLIMK